MFEVFGGIGISKVVGGFRTAAFAVMTLDCFDDF